MGAILSNVIINGEFAEKLTIFDRGLQYGDGVFETIIAENGQLQFWDDHIARLQLGCRRLKITEQDPKLLEAEIHQLLNNNNSRLIVKVIITRGSGSRGYQIPVNAQATRCIACYSAPVFPNDYYTKGVYLTMCRTMLGSNPLLAGIKHLNRLEQVLARSEWDNPDIVDGIMLNNDHLVIETTSANVFWTRSHHLFTPELDQCGVTGVMRRQVIELAKELQIPCSIGHFGIEELFSADEIFITNCVRGIWPVRQIDQRHWHIGTVTRQLMSALVFN